MLNKISREIRKCQGELSNDIEELRSNLNDIITSDAVDDMLRSNREPAYVVKGKLFIKINSNHYYKFAELEDGKVLNWHPQLLTNLILDEGITELEMYDIVKDIIVVNDLATSY